MLLNTWPLLMLHHHLKEKNVTHIQNQKVRMKIPNAYYWYSTSLVIRSQIARSVQAKWLSLASWLEIKGGATIRTSAVKTTTNPWSCKVLWKLWELWKMNSTSEKWWNWSDTHKWRKWRWSGWKYSNECKWLGKLVLNANWDANLCFKRKLQVKKTTKQTNRK